jgi:hypothetical protein
MKLHRLVLTNYRGVTHREIVFPDRGVVVVSGANEIGKSSMIEALDLLLEAKDRSTKKEVKQVKPTHADVGAEVTAEISTGPYRFIYRKRFHKKCETELTMLAPRREQLTGDEAHERVCAMLAETVDTELWQAQRVLQAASTAPVDLSGCDALSRALDVAAGEAVELSGAEPLLIDRIDAEYSQYFTATGRPTGEWAAATARLAAAEGEVARCAAAVAEVDDCVRRHAALSEQLAELAGQREAAAHRLAEARKAAEAVAELTAQLKQAELVAAAADATHAASVAALTERRRLREDVDARAETIAILESAAAEAAEAQATAREVHEAAVEEAEEARVAAQAAQDRADTARRTVDLLSDRDEADRLAVRLGKIDAARHEVERAERGLAVIALTDETMREIESAAAAVERASGQTELASARIELAAASDVELNVGRDRVVLAAGAQWTANATAPTDIEVPGVLTARVIPGAPATDLQAKLDAAQQLLTDMLARGDVADVAHARVVHQRRRELVAARERSVATVEGLCGDEPVEELGARLTMLRERQPTESTLTETDIAIARADLDTAVAARKQATADCETHRKVAALAAARLAEKSTEATAAREKLAAAQGELTTARDRLADQRAVRGDDEIASSALADGESARAALGRVAELGARLAEAQPDAVEAALTDAQRHADALGSRHDELTDELRELTTRLNVYGTEGRKGQLDAAETEREHAESEYSRVRRRARAVQLLRSVMTRHRDTTRLRYVEPFRAEVERLGRLVFGPSFEVEIDSDLRICSRTLAGRTVPYESLSGGAKEQLGIVARLAGASLVAKDDTVPVIIDDALGFTDADRLARMGAVFDAVGGDGQVIVLTCSPDRYDSVGAAQHIMLSA